jgi:hypothetical protein
MHDKLLRDVIMRQSGTLQKAVLEGGMNAIEAGATRVDVDIEPTRFGIKDDGKGFKDENEVELYFETFGQPHDESEGKIWAEFRMGRGQMFAFGRNVWRTGEFRMTVDINDRIGYDLDDGMKDHPGCEIDVELYDVISDAEIYRITREIGKYMKHVDVPVYVNGKQVNRPPADGKWTEVTDEAYMNLNASETGSAGIKVYNLGVFVTEIPRYHHGVGGTIVSRKQLKLNFARNDILVSKCPVWKKIAKSLGEVETVKKVVRKQKFNEAERSSLIHKFIAGEACPDGRSWADVPFFLDTTGHPWSYNRMERRFEEYTVAPAGDSVADALIQRGMILALDSDNVAEFEHEHDADVLGEIKEAMTNYGFARPPRYVPWDEANQLIDSRNDIVPDDDLTEAERIWVWSLETLADHWVPSHSPTRNGRFDWEEWNGLRDRLRDRVIKVGTSDSADAWTDGKRYIAFNREWLKSHPLMNKGRPRFETVMAAALLMAHELCHDGDSLSQGHTPDFYKEYHDMYEHVVNAAKSLFARLSKPTEQQRLQKRAKDEREKATRRKARQRKAKEKAIRDAKKLASAARKKKASKKKAPAKKKTAKKAKASPKPGRTASQVTDKREIKKILEAKADGKSYQEIEDEFGLRRSNGMNAYRIVQMWGK